MTTKRPVIKLPQDVNFKEFEPASIKSFIASVGGFTLAMSVPGKPKHEEVKELKKRGMGNPHFLASAVQYLQAIKRAAYSSNDFDLSTQIVEKEEVEIDLENQEASCETTERGKEAKNETIPFGEGYCGQPSTVSEIAFVASANISYKNGEAKPLQQQANDMISKYDKDVMVAASKGIVDKIEISEEGSLTRAEFAEKIAVAFDKASDASLATASAVLDNSLPDAVLRACRPKERIVTDDDGNRQTMLLPTTRYPIGPIILKRKKGEEEHALEDRYYKVCSAFNSFMGGRTSNSREVAKNAFDGIPLSSDLRKKINVLHNILATGLGTSERLYIHSKDSTLAAFIQRNLRPDDKKIKPIVYYKGHQEMSEEDKAELHAKGGIAAVDYREIEEKIPMVFTKVIAAFDSTGLDRARKKAKRALDEFFKRHERGISTRTWILQIPYYAAQMPFIISSEINSGLVLIGRGFEEHIPKYDKKENLDLVFNCMRASALYIYSRTPVIHLLNFLDGSNLPSYQVFKNKITLNMKVKGVRGYEYEDVFGTMGTGIIERTLRRTKNAMPGMTGIKSKDIPDESAVIAKKRANVNVGRRNRREPDEPPPMQSSAVTDESSEESEEGTYVQEVVRRTRKEVGREIEIPSATQSSSEDSSSEY